MTCADEDIPTGILVTLRSLYSVATHHLAYATAFSEDYVDRAGAGAEKGRKLLQRSIADWTRSRVLNCTAQC
jgi:hypothetical protein